MSDDDGVIDDTLASKPPPASSDQAAFQQLSARFRIDGKLGEGGMGIVLGAYDPALDRRVAIKLLKGKGALDSSHAQRFLREARAAAKLQSAHVARVFEAATLPSGEPYIVLEYLDGIDLARLQLTQTTLPVSEAVDYVLQACEGVAEAHAMGIVHRDLKPGNLFRTEGPDGAHLIKVLDFGISKVTDGGDLKSLTATGSLMGSPAYMSPEQVKDVKTVDARSDVWALGAILFQLLGGEPPFMADTPSGVLAKIILDEARPVRELARDVPGPVADVIAKCLEKDRDKRVQSVAELAKLLQPFGTPASAGTAERVARVLDRKSRPPRQAAAMLPMELANNTAASHPSLPGPRPGRTTLIAGIAAAIGASVLTLVIAKTSDGPQPTSRAIEPPPPSLPASILPSPDPTPKTSLEPIAAPDAGSAQIGVRFETTPPGADIILDGKKIGKTPQTIALDRVYRGNVVFKLAGHVLEKAEVRPERSTTVRATLREDIPSNR